MNQHHPDTNPAMDDALNPLLRSLVHSRSVAALGTVDKGEPYVSMVPYVLHGAGSDILIHVSGLSAHTRHMREHPRVSLMVTAAEGSIDDEGRAIEPQALPRVTIQGDAHHLDPAGSDYTHGKVAYLGRFPTAAQMFELPDFSLFAIRPQSARFIAGFGSAHSLNAETWARILRPA
jgi:putative heme iron utilization protein